MKLTTRISILAVAAATAFPTLSHANPPAAAEVTPQPPLTERAKLRAEGKGQGRGKGNARGMMKANAAKRDQKMLEEFETMFGRKLTDEQKTRLTKAAETRNAALMAAQEAYTKEFAQIAGVTEKELREKRREARMKEMGANGDAGANGPKKGRRNKKNQNPGNLPDGTPADAPGVAVAETPAN